jgi:hypothetical protein
MEEEIVEQKEVKHKIPYHTVLMSAISKASEALIYGDPYSAVLSLWSILPPEIREVLKPDWKKLNDDLHQINMKLYCEVANPMDIPFYRSSPSLYCSLLLQYTRQYCAKFLSKVVEVLDDNGLLREYKKEEIGGI